MLTSADSLVTSLSATMGVVFITDCVTSDFRTSSGVDNCVEKSHDVSCHARVHQPLDMLKTALNRMFKFVDRNSTRLIFFLNDKLLLLYIFRF